MDFSLILIEHIIIRYEFYLIWINKFQEKKLRLWSMGLTAMNSFAFKLNHLEG